MWQPSQLTLCIAVHTVQCTSCYALQHVTCIVIWCRPGIAYHLPNTKSDNSNLAIFQLTGNLPFSIEVVFLGGQSDVQKTIRGPVVHCQGCGDKDYDNSHEQPSIADRLQTLTGESACTFGLLLVISHDGNPP